MAGYVTGFSFIKDCITGAEMLPTKFLLLCRNCSTSVLCSGLQVGTLQFQLKEPRTAGQKPVVFKEDSYHLAAGHAD